MRRLMGGLVLSVLWVGFGGSARAQMPAPTTYGGFGMEYTQMVPANSYVLDRFWTIQATPAVGTQMPAPMVVQQPAVVQRPAVVQPRVNPRRVARAARAGRAFARGGAVTYGPAGLQYATPLPTGSLYWPGAPTAGTPIYTPAQRYASYGQGYGLSPYGSADYGSMYKGWGAIGY
jgi:hypothetical protein